MAHPFGAASDTRPAPCTATYTLHSVGPGGEICGPFDSVRVEQGRHVGIIHELDGTLIPYAAGRRTPVAEGTYFWLSDPEPRPPFFRRVYERLVSGAVLAVVGAGLIVMGTVAAGAVAVGAVVVFLCVTGGRGR